MSLQTVFDDLNHGGHDVNSMRKEDTTTTTLQFSSPTQGGQGIDSTNSASPQSVLGMNISTSATADKKAFTVRLARPPKTPVPDTPFKANTHTITVTIVDDDECVGVDSPLLCKGEQREQQEQQQQQQQPITSADIPQPTDNAFSPRVTGHSQPCSSQTGLSQPDRIKSPRHLRKSSVASVSSATQTPSSATQTPSSASQPASQPPLNMTVSSMIQERKRKDELQRCQAREDAIARKEHEDRIVHRLAYERMSGNSISHLSPADIDAVMSETKRSGVQRHLASLRVSSLGIGSSGHSPLFSAGSSVSMETTGLETRRQSLPNLASPIAADTPVFNRRNSVDWGAVVAASGAPKDSCPPLCTVDYSACTNASANLMTLLMDLHPWMVELTPQTLTQQVQLSEDATTTTSSAPPAPVVATNAMNSTHTNNLSNPAVVSTPVPVKVKVPKLLWMDRRVTMSFYTYSKMSEASVINFYPGTLDFTTKSHLTRRLTLMRELFPSMYTFYPLSWILPAQSAAFKSEFHGKRARERRDSEVSGVSMSPPVYIIKPNVGSQGSGIRLVSTWDDVVRTLGLIKAETAQSRNVAKHSAGEPGATVQVYIDNPLLVEGLKFDFRIYVVVVSVDPWEVYVYREGLARFATLPYQQPDASNLDTAYMHLTNYSLNKDSETFVRGNEDADDGSKRSITSVLQQIREEGYALSDNDFWNQVEDVVAKTLISIWSPIWGSFKSAFPNWLKPKPTPAPPAFSSTDSVSSDAKVNDVQSQQLVQRSPCFQVFGFDLMLDQNLRLWLLEINSQPSLHIDAPYDLAIKLDLVTRMLGVLGLIPKSLNWPKPSAVHLFQAPPTPPRSVPMHTHDDEDEDDDEYVHDKAKDHSTNAQQQPDGPPPSPFLSCDHLPQLTSILSQVPIETVPEYALMMSVWRNNRLERVYESYCTKGYRTLLCPITQTKTVSKMGLTFPLNSFILFLQKSNLIQRRFTRGQATMLYSQLIKNRKDKNMDFFLFQEALMSAARSLWTDDEFTYQLPAPSSCTGAGSNFAAGNCTGGNDGEGENVPPPLTPLLMRWLAVVRMIYDKHPDSDASYTKIKGNIASLSAKQLSRRSSTVDSTVDLAGVEVQEVYCDKDVDEGVAADPDDCIEVCVVGGEEEEAHIYADCADCVDDNVAPTDKLDATAPEDEVKADEPKTEEVVTKKKSKKTKTNLPRDLPGLLSLCMYLHGHPLHRYKDVAQRTNYSVANDSPFEALQRRGSVDSSSNSSSRCQGCCGCNLSCIAYQDMDMGVATLSHRLQHVLQNPRSFSTSKRITSQSSSAQLIKTKKITTTDQTSQSTTSAPMPTVTFSAKPSGKKSDIHPVSTPAKKGKGDNNGKQTIHLTPSDHKLLRRSSDVSVTLSSSSTCSNSSQHGNPSPATSSKPTTAPHPPISITASLSKTSISSDDPPKQVSFKIQPRSRPLRYASFSHPQTSQSDYDSEEHGKHCVLMIPKNRDTISNKPNSDIFIFNPSLPHIIKPSQTPMVIKSSTISTPRHAENDLNNLRPTVYEHKRSNSALQLNSSRMVDHMHADYHDEHDFVLPPIKTNNN